MPHATSHASRLTPLKLPTPIISCPPGARVTAPLDEKEDKDENEDKEVIVTKEAAVEAAQGRPRPREMATSCPSAAGATFGVMG